MICYSMNECCRVFFYIETKQLTVKWPERYIFCPYCGERLPDVVITDLGKYIES